MQELIPECAADADWETRYKPIIEKGRALTPLPKQYREERFKVRGCQSQVWLQVELDQNKRVCIFACSDALIVRGVVPGQWATGDAEQIYL